MTGDGCTPALHVTTTGEPEVRFADVPRIILGRDGGCDVVLDDKLVSREHCVVERHPDRWVLIDGSRNGTFLAGAPVRSCQVVAGELVVIRLGDPAVGPSVTLRVEPGPREAAAPTSPAASPPGRQPAATEMEHSHRLGHRPLTIGRVRDNDVVLDDVLVSGYHAAVERLPDGRAGVVDLGGRNGTFVNGHPVVRAAIAPGDRLAIGRHTFSYDGAGVLLEHATERRDALAAEHLSVTLDGRAILSDVTFTVRPGTFLAIIGPSGAGKSTLLRALTGTRAADTGRVLVDGIDLYPAYDEVRHRIGLVPQEDVLHDQLKVEQALRYAAALRLPDDVRPNARDERVASVLAQLDLVAQHASTISRLSGGQRKRASVAMELLTEPSLLYLDEPTSGLDPLLDREVMRGLRTLADRRRTVVVVTHNVLYLRLCHQVLVLARGGRPAYLGPPDQLLAHFGAHDYADVFTELSSEATAWSQRFTATAPAVRPPTHRPPPPAPPRQGWFRQFSVLLSRAAALTIADRRHLAFMLGLPLVLAAVVQTVPRTAGLAPPPGATTTRGTGLLLVILILGGAFIGIATSIRDLVVDRPIYHRERAVGLRPTSYLGAKLTVNATVCVLQAALLAACGLLGRHLPAHGLMLNPPLLELTLILAVTAFAASTAGLLAGALVPRPEHTMPILVVSVMAQLVLSGGLFSIADRNWLQAAAVISPTRWGYAAAASAIDLRRIAPASPAEGIWRHEPHIWFFSIGMLVVLATIFTFLTLVALRAREQRPR